MTLHIVLAILVCLCWFWWEYQNTHIVSSPRGHELPGGQKARPTQPGSVPDDSALVPTFSKGLRSSPLPAGRPFYTSAADADLKINPHALGAEFLIKGRIIAENGKAIAGASVSLNGSRDPWTRKFEDRMVIESTDGNGYYEIHLKAPIQAWVSIEKIGFASVEEWLDLESPGVIEKNFTLRRGSGRIEGRVVDNKNNPIPAVFVGVTFPQVYSAARQSHISPRSVVSDFSGGFALDDLPEGEVTLSVLAHGYLPEGKVLRLRPGEVSQVYFHLNKAHIHLVTVRNTKGESISSAVLRTSSGMFFRGNERGVIDLQLPSESESQVFNAEVSAEGYLSKTELIDPRSPPSTLVLDEGPLLTGRVLSVWGKPVIQARVVVLSGGQATRGLLERPIRSGPAGEFSLRLSRLPVREIRAYHPDYVEALVRFENQVPHPYVEIRLQSPDGGLYGRVVDSKGNPIPHFRISLWDSSGGMGYHRTFDNSQGVFSIPDLPAGVFKMRVNSLVEGPDFGLHATLDRVEVRKGQFYGEIVVQLQRRDGS